MLRHGITIAAIVIAIAPFTATCQAPGQRVRVSIVGEHGRTPWVMGRLDAFHGDTAFVRLDGGETRTFVLDANTRMDRSVGTHNNAMLGLFAGMLVGKAIGSRYDSREDPDFASGMMATMGGFLGLLAGFGIKSTNWSHIAPSRTDVTLWSTTQGVGLRISLPDWRY